MYNDHNIKKSIRSGGSHMAKQEFSKFRELLESAMGDCTQAQFAMESGISPEHLNRMLNAETINRPSNTTLTKISNNARHGITYQMFVNALNQEDDRSEPNTKEELIQKFKDQDAKRDFAPDFESQVKATFAHLSAQLDYDAMRHNYQYTEDPLDYLEKTLKTLKEQHPDDLPVSYYLNTSGPYFGHEDGINGYIAFMLTVANWEQSATSDLIVYLTDDHIKKCSMNLKAVIDIYGMPPSVLEDHEYEDVSGLKYYYEITKNVKNKIPRHYKGASTEENVLKMLFGTTIEFPETILGAGFELPDIPENFHEFIQRHLGQTVEPYDDDSEHFYELINNITENINDPQALAKFFDDFEYLDLTSMDTGWGAVLAHIMTAETGMPFAFYKNTVPEKTKNFKDYPYELSPHPVILIRDADIEANQINHDALLNAIYKFARVFRLKEFGHLIFHHIKKQDFVHTDLYPINYDAKPKKKERDCMDDGIVRICPDFLAFPEHKPDTIGIYEVRLKDKRFKHMLYIPDKGHWVSCHKEWSDWIEAYHPEPIRMPKQDDTDTDANPDAKTDTQTNNDAHVRSKTETDDTPA